MEEMPGYVYVLSNPAMPHVVKIGRSINGGSSRARQLYQTGVPEPFTLEFEIYTHDCIQLEEAVHQRLEKDRVSASREFFKITAHEAIEAVMDEFGSGSDLTTRRIDLSVDPAFIYWMAYKVSELGVDAIAPDITHAFRFLDPKAYADAITKWTNFIDSQKEIRLQNEESGN